MSFYVERIIIHNRAPFEHIDLEFKDKSISVLTALNGKGKTTILSYRKKTSVLGTCFRLLYILIGSYNSL